MKKILFSLLALCNCLSLTSCNFNVRYEKSSLTEYIEYIKHSGIGNSSVEIDHPDYFIPSISFFEDYNYIEGGYYWGQDDIFKFLISDDVLPEIAIIYLKYNENIYYNAKQFMVENMPVYNDEFYIYNNYNFYIHEKFINRFSEDFPMPELPYWFNMAAYNDLNFTLVFIGFFDQYPRVEEKYYSDFKSNFPELLVTYYSKYFNFNK